MNVLSNDDDDKFTGGSSSAPSGGDTTSAGGDAGGGGSQTHRRDAGRQLGWRGQFEQSDVIVEGVSVVVRVADGLQLEENCILKVTS